MPVLSKAQWAGHQGQETLMNLETEEERPGVAEMEYHSSLSVE